MLMVYIGTPKCKIIYLFKIVNYQKVKEKALFNV